MPKGDGSKGWDNAGSKFLMRPAGLLFPNQEVWLDGSPSGSVASCCCGSAVPRLDKNQIVRRVRGGYL